MTIRFTATADASLSALITWLAERSPAAARKATMSLVNSIDRLNDFAELAAGGDDGRRELTVRFGRDGFIVRYRIEGPDITVEDILHGRQDR